MSDISDSENISLSESVDAAGSTASTSSMSSSSVGEATGPRDRTPNHLSGISDIPSGSDPVTPTSRGQTGAARLEEILRVGPSTVPDRQFVEELGRAAQARLAPIVDLTAEGGGASERTASQASTSGRSDDVTSDSTDPSGEEIRPANGLVAGGPRVNDMKVYRRADVEMVELAGDCPVYTADYYTFAVILRYLAALRREFSIPDDVDLVVSGLNDLPSRPPSGHIALSAEYFRAGLRLPFHPFLRRTLTSLNVAPAQLNANAYRVLVGCYILWAAKFSETLPFFTFQNLYRMKTAPSSKGFYYFQGFKGTFITGCPDSDKQFKHLWFYAAEGSLKEYWVGSSLTSCRPDDQPRTTSPRVMIARMPEPAVHYRSRTSRPVVTTADVQSGVPRGVPEATVRGSSSGDLSPRAWGPRVADEDLDLVIRELFPARGLRIEERMADRERRGTMRPSTEERIARLQKNARLGKDKGKEGASTVPPSGGAALTVAPTKTVAPPVTQTSRPASRPEVRTDRPREDRPREERPREDRQPGRHEVRSGLSREDRPTVLPPVPRSGRDELRPCNAPLPSDTSPESSVHRVLVSKFADQLSTEVAESSRRSDHMVAISDSTAKPIETLCILFSGSVAAKTHTNRMANEVKSAEADARSARRSEKEAKTARGVAEEAKKEAEDRAKAADERARLAEDELRCVEDWAKKAKHDSEEAETSRLKMETALKRAEQELAAARAEHRRYLEVAFPAVLDDARAQAVEEYLRSEDFRARLVSEYQEGMRDMKAGFIATNSSSVGVDWSFVPEESEETATERAAEEGEVTGAAPVPENVVVLDDLDQPEVPDQPVASEQPAAGQPTSPALDMSMSDLFPDQLD
ncbi:hypothetical protein TIFTF001_028076 [Ficus carica]|uniref:Uncharacterized protein n=1 Tax=Ficus carica TaxID=3494 RepID=A0AA88DPA1_FICCA|nr:hypothetical protein TIFTF001_028076 [Ficus carica]